MVPTRSLLEQINLPVAAGIQSHCDGGSPSCFAFKATRRELMFSRGSVEESGPRYAAEAPSRLHDIKKSLSNRGGRQCKWRMMQMSFRVFSPFSNSSNSSTLPVEGIENRALGCPMSLYAPHGVA